MVAIHPLLFLLLDDNIYENTLAHFLLPLLNTLLTILLIFGLQSLVEMVFPTISTCS
jgi:hypothetical protein